MENYPKVSFVIPTLNAQKQLTLCLEAIRKQDYPKKKLELIISDGGSTDKTLSIAKKYKCKIISNPLKTAEAGKAVGLKIATGEYVALIDSDNILPNTNWLKLMVNPLTDQEIIGSEPIKFTYRKNAGFIERYSSLIGANDPYAFVSGVYDRQNYINNKWTGLKIEQKKYLKYIKITLKPNQTLPTIGANGTIFRTKFLQENIKDQDYLFDIDVLSQFINKNKKKIYFAKVKTGIIHTYCENSTAKFIRKQRRRIIDYFFYQPLRQYNWESSSTNNNIKFAVYTGLILPAIADSIKGYVKKPDIAWFFHPIACQITLWIYIISTLKNKLGLLKPINRNQWQQ